MSRNQAFVSCGVILFVLLLVATWATPAVSASLPTPSKKLRVFEFPLDSGCINTFLAKDAITVRVTAEQALDDVKPAGCYPEIVKIHKTEVIERSPRVEKPKSLCKTTMVFEVFFDFDKYNIQPDQEPVFQDLVKWIKKCGKYIEEINMVGHCDSRGTDDYNNSLGYYRAGAVMDKIGDLKYDIGDSKTGASWGFRNPEDGFNSMSSSTRGEDDATGDHAFDRRVDIIVVPY